MKLRKKLRYKIKTFGCQVNESDSEKLSLILDTLDMEETPDLKEADIYIINSCSVRQKSEDKVYGLARKLKDLEKKPFVVLAGCMVGSTRKPRERTSLKELQSKTPWVDLYISPEDLSDLPYYLIQKGFVTEEIGLVSQEEIFLSKGVVNISYGCDNFCSYCVVPYSRGKEVSRPEEEILEEVRSLLNKKVTSITLCGQNVNSWGLSPKEKVLARVGEDMQLPFAKLLRRVHCLPGLEKLSFMSSNPFDFTDDLVETMKLPLISDYLHIAVQSGNNEVLKRMNRRHTVEEFISLVERIKKVRPNIKLGTDIIVGFPDETNEQFMDTVNLFRKISFSVAYISMYSVRPGTVAAKTYEDNVSLKEKKRRHALLTKVWKETRKKK